MTRVILFCNQQIKVRLFKAWMTLLYVFKTTTGPRIISWKYINYYTRLQLPVLPEFPIALVMPVRVITKTTVTTITTFGRHVDF